jgi:hypothetical protein
MRRYLQLVVLGAVLASSGLAIAAEVGPTAQGYSFDVEQWPSWLYLPTGRMDPGRRYPSAATITVHVRGAQQQRVDGVPVSLEVGPECQDHVVLTPQSMITRNGVAQAAFEAKDKSGFCHVTVQVGELTEQVRFNIQERGPEAGGSGYRNW